MGNWDWLLGTSPDDVEIPPEVRAAQERRRQLGDMLSQIAFGRGPTEGERAVDLQRRLGGDELLAQQNAMAAGARGLGAGSALRRAQLNTAMGQQRLGGQAALAAAQTRAQERQAAQAMLAQTLAQQEQSAYGLNEYQRANAGGGLLPTAIGLGGAALGGLVGGPQGAVAGYQLGTAGTQAARGY